MTRPPSYNNLEKKNGMISSFFVVKVIKQLPEKMTPNAVICIAAGNDGDWTWGGLDLGNQGPRRGRAAAAIAIMPTWADTRNVCVSLSVSLSLLQLSQTPMTSAHRENSTRNGKSIAVPTAIYR